jgi:single-stranded-DNA-specific exonuclease
MWKMKDIDGDRKKALEEDGMMEFFATILSNRDNGVRSKSDAVKHAMCEEKHMESPKNLANMEKAAKIVKETGGKACIFGDYDVDGVTSTYMARKMFRDLGYEEVKSFIPQRDEDGYGLNDKSVENLIKSTAGMEFDIILVLDCGSSSKNHINVIRERWPNAKIVVVDHHLIEDENFSSNADAIVNPRIGDSHPFCTGGLMMQMARLLFDKEKQREYFPYGAMATIADVCVLQGTNRIMVSIGLEEIKKTKDIGIRKMFEVANKNIDKCTVEDIGFSIAPMINAAGRISNANIALMTLEEKDDKRAESLANELHCLNEQRKDIQKDIFQKVSEQIGERGTRKSILVCGDWNPGVVGIVAGQLAERYSCPAICFGKGKDGSIKGSARSKEGINIKEVMDSCNEMFSRYGGHEQAAGASLKDEYEDRAWDIFEEAVVKYMETKGMNYIPTLYDVEITPRMMSKIDDKFCERLDAFAPFGNGNERPVIRVNGIMCHTVHEWSSGKGGFIKMDKVNMDAYAMVDGLKDKMQGKVVDILFTIERSFMEEGKWAIRVQKAKMSEI